MRYLRACGKEEVMNLRWADVDLERGRAILHKTKNGERRAVPIGGVAHQLLTKLRCESVKDGGLLFPSNRNLNSSIDLRFPWERALMIARIENFRFHDLRHTAASYMAMSGASLLEIAEVLGHKTLSMVKRYAHLCESHTAKVMARMNEKIFGEDGAGLMFRLQKEEGRNE